MNKNLKSTIQENYNYTDYEMAKLNYTLIALASELSKMIIFGLLFYWLGYFLEFVFALAALLLIRCYVGGLHFRHYVSCFSFTLCIFLLSILVLPKLEMPLGLQIITLFFCTLITYIVGPITSLNRPLLNYCTYIKCRNRGCRFMVLLSCLIILLPNFSCSDSVFWIIVLQTIQLVIARCVRKGDLYEIQQAKIC